MLREAKEAAERELAAERLSHQTDQAHDEQIINALRGDLAALRADARRWQWLRGHTGAQIYHESQRFRFPFPRLVDYLETHDLLRGSVAGHLDAAVDAALRAEPGAQGG